MKARLWNAAGAVAEKEDSSPERNRRSLRRVDQTRYLSAADLGEHLARRVGAKERRSHGRGYSLTLCVCVVDDRVMRVSEFQHASS